MKRPRILLADDHKLMAEALQHLLQTDFDVVQMASAVSYTVPAGGGTITSWTTQAPDLAFVGPVNLAVWTLKSPGTYTLVGLSASEPITKIGANMFAANIPVLGGELLGLHVGLNGLGQTYCLLPTAAATPPTNIIGYGTDSAPTIGTDHAMSSLPDFQLNVSAVVSTSPPPPPPPPPADGCDQSGASTANAQCVQDGGKDKKPAKPEAKP